MAERRGAAEPRHLVRCPGCGGDSVYAPSNPHRPFCSERCRLADLGAWASEGYRVGTSPIDDQEGGDKDASPPDAA